MSQGQFVVFHETGKELKFEQRAIPAPGPGEILVRNEYTTLCRSDLNTFSGKRQEKNPTILGHEIVGRIDAFGPRSLGKDVSGRTLEPGDRITWGIYASDPSTKMAQKGIPQKSSDLFKYGHEQLTDASCFHGGLSSHTLLRPHTPVLKIAESVPLKVASLINCAVATVAGAMRLAGEVEGETVIISGVGMLGIVACAMASVGGAKEVIAVDISEERLNLAQHFGAHTAIQPHRMERMGRSAQVVIELSGTNSAMEASLDWLQIGGAAVWVGGTYPQEPLEVNAEEIIRNLLTIKGLHNYNQSDLIRAVDFMEAHHQAFPFVDLVHEIPALQDAQEAFEYAIQHNPYRVGIRLAE